MRLGRGEAAVPCGVGLKGAVVRTKPGAVSTAASSASEERNKPRESSRLGLWRNSLPIYYQSFISERLALWTRPLAITLHPQMIERLGR